ncbi:hypothetical protein ABIF63_005411 [Bradyrhizobium japonicum]|uniref:Uncharacterized protein n=1 Tax=Bradyrhizobium japonicum TaxID=375 RepID=A0ABV2RXJ1_BRAJP
MCPALVASTGTSPANVATPARFVVVLKPAPARVNTGGAMQGVPHISVPICEWRHPDASRMSPRPHRRAAAFPRLSLSSQQTGSTRLMAKQLHICSKVYWWLKRSARPFAVVPGARAFTLGPGASAWGPVQVRVRECCRNSKGIYKEFKRNSKGGVLGLGRLIPARAAHRQDEVTRRTPLLSAATGCGAAAGAIRVILVAPQPNCV